MPWKICFSICSILTLLISSYLISARWEPAEPPEPPEPEPLRMKCEYITDEYAPAFRLAVKKHWPGYLHTHWELLMAQCYTESNLNPTAISPAGAKGICQFMPATWDEVAKGSPFNADNNIEAAAIYMNQQMQGWTTPRPTACKIELAWAGYNAGFGNILRAQKQAGGALCWDNIKVGLPKVTGEHSTETINYVERNWRHFTCLSNESLQ